MTLIGVEVDSDRRIATVTLNNAERRNSLTMPMVDEIVEAFDDLESRDDVGAVVVTGAPPAFCAGADLGHLGGGSNGGGGGADRAAPPATAAPADAGLRTIYEGFLRVARCPLPTIAAVNGAAVGAGMNLALCCDVRVAGRKARFDTRFLQLGLHPGGGHTWMLQNAIGRHAATALVLFGEVVDGAEAERIGLAWRCFDDDALLTEAQAMAAKAASAPPKLSRRVKETLAAVANLDDHGEAVDVELEAQVWSRQQPEFRERLAAMQSQITRRQ